MYNVAELEDELWRYAKQFGDLLDSCMEVLFDLSIAHHDWTHCNAIRRCHNRLRLWSSGTYRQLLCSNDFCSRSVGAQALLSSLALSIIEITIVTRKSWLSCFSES